MVDPYCRHKVEASRGQSAQRTSIDFRSQSGMSNPVVNAQLSKEMRRLYAKEVDIINAIGPMSIPERTYPKTFKVKRKEDQDDQENQERVPGEEQDRKEPIEAEPIEETGDKKTPAS